MSEQRTKEELLHIVEELSKGNLEDCIIRKLEVTDFGEIIRNRTDFLHFHGNSQKGGNVIYKYLDEPRS